MNMKIKSVCVFCGSKFGEGLKYQHIATDLGHLIGKQNLRLVYGAGGAGLMGIVAKTTLSHGSDVYGVTTNGLQDLEKSVPGIELDVVPTIQKRKRMMMDAADAFIVLPGGIGTLDEITEVLVAHQIGAHSKPLILLNIDGYFDSFCALLEEMKAEEFISPQTQKRFKYAVVHRVDEVIKALEKMGYSV